MTGRCDVLGKIVSECRLNRSTTFLTGLGKHGRNGQERLHPHAKQRLRLRNSFKMKQMLTYNIHIYTIRLLTYHTRCQLGRIPLFETRNAVGVHDRQEQNRGVIRQEIAKLSARQETGNLDMSNREYISHVDPEQTRL